MLKNGLKVLKIVFIKYIDIYLNSIMLSAYCVYFQYITRHIEITQFDSITIIAE